MNNTHNKYKMLVLVFHVMFFFFIGCTTVEEQKDPAERYPGQVTLFLNGPEKASMDITFEIVSVSIISEEGTSREVISGPVRINSKEITNSQTLLGETTLPEGKYREIRFMIKEALVIQDGAAANLALSPGGTAIDVNATVRRRQNTSLFVNWNADASIQDGYLFDPLLTVGSEAPELSTLLIYVTNEGSDNVSVINRQTGEVVATILVGSRPRGIAAALGRERSRVYVANSGSNSVSVIDPTTNQIENEIHIKFGREPEGIAVAPVSADEDLVFVTNYASNSVSVIDSTTFQEVEKVDVGQGPVAAAADSPVDTLLGTRFLGIEDVRTLRSYREKFFNVYVANRNSNEVSVLRIDKVTKRSTEVITVDVEWKPVALEVDYPKGKVYVANYGSDKLSVIDIVGLIEGNQSGAVTTINNLGNNATDVIADPAFDRIYLLREIPGEVLIFRPFKEGIDSLQSIMPPIVGNIIVGDLPRNFKFDPDIRKLYVVNSGSNTVSEIDKTTRRVEKSIPVGEKPYGIAMFPRLGQKYK